MFAKVKIILTVLLILFGGWAAALSAERGHYENSVLVVILAVLGSVSILSA